MSIKKNNNKAISFQHGFNKILLDIATFPRVYRYTSSRLSVPPLSALICWSTAPETARFGRCSGLRSLSEALQILSRDLAHIFPLSVVSSWHKMNEYTIIFFLLKWSNARSDQQNNYMLTHCYGCIMDSFIPTWVSTCHRLYYSNILRLSITVHALREFGYLVRDIHLTVNLSMSKISRKALSLLSFFTGEGSVGGGHGTVRVR